MSKKTIYFCRPIVINMKLFKPQEKHRKSTLQIIRLMFPLNSLQGRNAYFSFFNRTSGEDGRRGSTHLCLDGW